MSKSRKGYNRKSERTRQKNKRGDIEKLDQTDSPAIPDRGGKHQQPPASFQLKVHGLVCDLAEQELGCEARVRNAVLGLCVTLLNKSWAVKPELGMQCWD